jgi:hypothetical protein
MKTGPALALIAAGAILAFAVHAHLRSFSFQIAGWVIMLTGIAGLVIPRRGHSWLRRVTRRAPRRGRTVIGACAASPAALVLRLGLAVVGACRSAGRSAAGQARQWCRPCPGPRTGGGGRQYRAGPGPAW